jgi:prepilin-type N-terminal cleavage/methylation domain-containing protein
MFIHERHHCPAASECSLRRARLLSRGAFSLVELAVVLVLMAIVLAIAAPRWMASTDRHRTELAAGRVASMIELARTRALQQGRTWFVRAEAGSSTMSIGPTEDPASATIVELGLDPLRAKIARSTINAASGFGFDAFGAPSGDGKVRLECGSMATHVQVQAISGSVDVGQVFLASVPTLVLFCSSAVATPSSLIAGGVSTAEVAR